MVYQFPVGSTQRCVFLRLLDASNQAVSAAPTNGTIAFRAERSTGGSTLLSLTNKVQNTPGNAAAWAEGWLSKMYGTTGDFRYDLPDSLLVGTDYNGFTLVAIGSSALKLADPINVQIVPAGIDGEALSDSIAGINQSVSALSQSVDTLAETVTALIGSADAETIEIGVPCRFDLPAPSWSSTVFCLTLRTSTPTTSRSPRQDS